MSEDTPVRGAQLTEEEGCALLKARVEAAGFTMSESHRFTEYGGDVTLDGIDLEKGVGYESITTAGRTLGRDVEAAGS